MKDTKFIGFNTGLYGTNLNNMEDGKAKDYAISLTLKNRFNYVYIIKGTHKGNISYKIGKADNLYDRLKKFEVKIPFDIDLVMSFYVDNAISFESFLHMKFKDKRKAGEWFDLSEKDLLRILSYGLSKEEEDISICINKDIKNTKDNLYSNDKEYIEYLESILVMNNINFIAKGI